MSVHGGGLNRSTQHFILNGKDGVSGDQSKISSRFHCGREDRVVGSLAAGGVAQSDWAGVWQAVIFHLLPSRTARGIRPAPRRRSRLALTLAEREEISRGIPIQTGRSVAEDIMTANSVPSRSRSNKRQRRSSPPRAYRQRRE